VGKLTRPQRREREQAELEPSTSNVGDMLDACGRQHGRTFESPPALVKPYSTAYKKATDEDPPPDAVFWKLAKGSDNVQVGKDMAKVAYHAGQLAERERGGGKADVLLLKYREANCIGMTKLGFECWMHMLKKISPEYLLSLRRKPQPSDDYSQQIKQLQLGPEGEYVGASNVWEWHDSPTVKAGSMFANPYKGVKDSAESMRLFRKYVEARASPGTTTEQVIDLLPPNVQALARKRHVNGSVHEGKGKSVAHLRLEIVADAFRTALSELRGKRLGCWCDAAKIKEGLCHATVIESVAGTRCEHPYEYPNGAWIITWGDVAMNEVEMQRIGQMAERGVPVERLREIKVELEAKGTECVLIDLRQLLPE